MNSGSSDMARGPFAVLLALTLCAVAVLGAANLQLGNLNQDEGWYLYAARMVAGGAFPYRDFAYTQAPVFPLMYGGLYGVVRAYGLAGGRFLTLLFGWAAGWLAAWTAYRMAPRDRARTAFAVAVILALLNVYHSYYTTIVKTYALCAFFIAAGGLCLTYARAGQRRSGLAAAATAVCFTLAAGTRISAGMLLPVVSFALLFQRSWFGSWAWLYFGLAGVLTSVVVFLLPWGVAPEAFWFCNFSYHSGRSAGDVLSSMVYKAGFVSRWVQGYLLLFLAAAAVLVRRRFGAADTSFGGHAFDRTLWAMVLGVTLVHVIAPFPYEDYQAIIMPVAACALALALVRQIPGQELPAIRGSTLAVLFFCFGLLTCAASPVLQDWVIRGRDRIWWKTKEGSDLAKLQRVAREVRAMAGDRPLLLTQDAYLAVEADMEVPRGLEMGPFCYYPDLTDEEVAQYHVMNRSSMLRLLSEGAAPVAAFSGYGLSIRSPEILPLDREEQEALRQALQASYEWVREVPHFGQAHTTLNIYKRKPAAAP